MVRKFTNKASLALEPLEARVLLSGVAVSPEVGLPDVSELSPEAAQVAIAETVEEQLDPSLQSPAEAGVDDIFAGVGESVLEVDSVAETSTETGRPGDETGDAGAVPASDTAMAGQPAEIPNPVHDPANSTMLEFGGVPPLIPNGGTVALEDPAISSIPGAAPVATAADLLTETLHAANGPPTGTLSPAEWALRSSPRVFSPGHSPGEMTINGPEIWSGSESYVWEINDVDGVEGLDPGWDFLQITGDLKIQSTVANKFTLKITSLTLANAAGNVADFNAASSYSWRILSATGGITGFDRSTITVSTTSFSNSLGSGAFVLDQSLDGRDLILRFVPNLPSVSLELDPVNWVEEGPFSSTENGNTIIPPDDPVIGAVQSIALHPQNSAIGFVGSVNGGVWRSTNLDTATPSWTPLTDALMSLSVSSLAVSPFDAANALVTPATPVNQLVLYLGTGSFSSAGGRGGAAAGLFKSTDGGTTWTVAGDFDGQRITSIVPSRASAGLVFIGTYEYSLTSGPTEGIGGVWRTLNGGTDWERLSGQAGLPEYHVTDMVEDPGTAGRIYVGFAGPGTATAGTLGVYRTDLGTNADRTALAWQSLNTGLTPDYDHDGVFAEAGETPDNALRIRLSVSAATGNPLYAAFIGNDRMLASVFRYTTAAGSWTQLGGLPQTNPTGQGNIHFGMVADPTNANSLFIAGAVNGTSPYVGIAFRWDGGTTWVQITTTSGSGPGSYNTAPHGDFRALAFLANTNDLLAASDGGLYRITNPRSANASPAWTFVGSGLRITEIGHSVAYDHNTNSIIAGTQDTGVVRQTGTESIWTSLLGGDGNFVAVEYNGATTTRYFMGNNFASFYRIPFTGADSSGALTQIRLKSASGAANYSGLDSTTTLASYPTFPADAALASGSRFESIPFATNAAQSGWLLIGRFGLYKSRDQGDTIAQITSLAASDKVTALAYGGFKGATAVKEVIYAARGTTVAVSSNDGASFSTATPAGASSITDIALDPTNWQTAVAIDANHVWLLITADDGTLTAYDATGNLDEVSGTFESVEVVSRDGKLVVIVGTRDGAYVLGIDDLATFTAATPPAAAWVRFGSGLPNVPVSDLEYDATDDVLVAGTLGRGAWSVLNASQVLFEDRVLRIDTAGSDDEVRIRLAANAVAGPSMLEVVVGATTVGSYELRSIRAISVHTGGGNDTLIIDSVNGEVVTPGNIFFNGMDGSDTLDFQGPTTSGLETDSEGSLEIRQMGRQIVRALNVETFEDTTFFEDFLAILRKAWDAIVDFFRDLGELLNFDLPTLGDVLGSALNGIDFESQLPIGDPDVEGAPAADEPFGEVRSGATSFIERLLESTTGFRFEDVGTAITDPAELQSILDALDPFPGNVTVDGTTKRFVLGSAANPFRRTLEFDAPLNAELLGGVLQIHGFLEFAVDIDLRLEMGVDARGFYLATAAFPQPEVVVHNLRVDGSVTASGNFGFLEVTLEDATLALDPDVRIEINLLEPAGADAFGHAPDGKLRLYDLTSSLSSLVSVSLLGDPAADDIVFTMGIRVSAMEPDGESLFDIPVATIEVTWPDITDPLKVSVRPVGGPAEIITTLLNFSFEDMYGELKRLLNYLGQLGKTALLDVELPFADGLSFGQSFDFSTAFLDTIYAKLVDIRAVASTGNGNPTGDLALGRLSADAAFTLSISEGDPISVTVSAATTAANNSLQDLVDDFNVALSAAGLGTQVRAFLDRRQVALRLLSGSSMKVGGADDSSAFTELGFIQDAPGIEFPKFPSLQKLLAEFEELLDPDGAGPLTFDVDPEIDLAGRTLSFKVSFGYEINESTQFVFDPDIGLGDLADVSFSGDFGLAVDLDLSFTLGINLAAFNTPRLLTGLALPPPSSGRLTGPSTFAINLNDGTRYDFSLPLINTSGNSQLSHLVDDLNALLVGPMFGATPLNQVIRFVQGTSGNSIILEAINEDKDADGVLDPGEDADGDTQLDSWLEEVTAIAIEADNADVIVTEVGFSNQRGARSVLKGLFLEDVALSGTLTVTANNLEAEARLAIFEVSTSGGTAVGTGGITIGFTNPTDVLHPTRLDLDTLLKNLANIGDYFSPATELTGSIDLQLNNITVTPNLPTLSGDPLIPAGSQFRIYIPDVHFLDYNANPYDAVTNNQGLFVTYPQLGSFGDFSCVSFLDVVATLDSLSDQLEGLKGFSFLNQPLPLLNMSIGDVLDFAGDLSRAFSSLAAGDVETIETLEKDLEDFFNVSPDKLSLSVDNATVALTAGGSGSTAATTRFNPSGSNNALTFTAKTNGTTQNGWTIDFLDDQTLTSGADDAQVSVDATKKTLTIKYNATYTTADTVIAKVNAVAASPFSAGLDTSGTTGDGATNDGSGVLTETALKFHLEYSLFYGEFLPFAFSLADLVALVPPGPIQSLLTGITDIIQVEGSGSLNVSAEAALALDFGLDVSSKCNFIPFLYDSTGLTLSAAVRGTALNFKAGIGALNVSVKNGTVTIDGDGNPATTTDSAEFVVGFKDNNGDGRHYFRSDETFFDSNSIDIGLTAAASANLPLFALDSLPIGSTSDGPDAGNEPDNWLVFQSGPLQQLLGGDGSAVVLRAPDLSSLFDNINLCDLITNSPILLDGLDALLGTVQDALGSTFGRNLPLVGGQLGKAADFIGDFRSGLLAELRSTLASVGDPIQLAKEAIFDSLGAGGLDLLVKPDGTPLTTADEVDIICDENGITFNLRLKKAIALVDTSGDPIDFDIGIPGFGLEVDGNVKIEAGFDFKLKFGLNTSDGFYFDTSDSEEFRLEFRVTIPGLNAKGELLFLQLDVADDSDGKDLKGNPRNPSSFVGYFTVDLKDPIGSGNRLTFGDLTNPGLNVSKLVDAEIGATAEVNLEIAVSFGGSAQFPRLVAEFDLDWNWTPGGSLDGDFSFGFHNLSLDIGSFVSDFIRPILDKLRVITEPLGPVVTVLTTPIPIISDIAGEPYTLLDLAELWGMITPETRKFIDVIVVIVELANDTSVSDDGNILLPIGGFELDVDKFGRVDRKAGDTDGPVAALTDVQDEPAKSFLGKLEEIGITFPFLSVAEVFKLFLGQPVSLVEYHLPTLDFEASFELAIPIIGPLYVKFGGSIGAYADLTIGFDTYGIQKYLSSDDKNILDIFDGFYIKDVDDDGVDVPELTLTGSLWAAGSIDIVIAEAGVRGGLEAQIDFNLNDPDDDGRVRVSEIIANAKQDIRCIFDIHGEFKAFLEAYLIIDLFFFQIDETFRFAEITILEFDIVCPVPVLANYVNVTGSELEVADATGSLRLNMGDYADEREEGDTADGDEKFTVVHIDGDPSTAEGETVEVSFNGIKQTYFGVKKIWAVAGKGNDTLDLRGVLAPVDTAAGRGIHGGSGNDTIYAGRGAGRYDGDDGDDVITAEESSGDFAGVVDEFHGGAGDDILTGWDLGDKLYGDDGADTLLGYAGDDLLEGGAGNDTIEGDLDNDTLLGGDGADNLDGYDGNDQIEGGDGDDTLTGGRGDDKLIGGNDDDTIDGGSGNDVILGDLGTIVSALQVTGVDGSGDDLLAGGPGADIIFGADGDDAIFGGTLLVSGVATPGGDTDEEDFVDGGAGNDVVFGDDAHSAAATTFPGANIGSRVWFDALDANGNRNNLFDDGEMGVPGIKVELFDSANTLIASTTTDPTGAYLFTGLQAGDYYVKFTLPTGLAFVIQDAGDDEIDSDANGATGRTTTFSVTAGQTDDTWDAGVQGTTPILVIDDPSIEEGDTGITNLVFTVTLSSVSDKVVTVCYHTNPDTALNIVDYSSTSWTLVFEPGETVKTVEIPILGDDIDEIDEQFEVLLSQPYNATIDAANDTGTGTIIDDDDAPSVSIEDGEQVTVLDPIPEATGMTFVISLSRPSSRTIQVDYQTRQIVDASGVLVFDAARAGADYSAAFETILGTLTFNPGETEKSVVIPVLADALDEYDEQFSMIVTLNPATATDLAVIGDGLAHAVIADDDATPFVEWSIADLPFAPDVVRSVNEGHAGNTKVSFNLHLTAVSGRDVTVDWNTSRGTAVSAAPEGEYPDFLFANDSVVFRQGETDKTVTVEVIGDTRGETNEDFYVNLIKAINGQINTTDDELNHARVIIRNDESGDPGPWYVEFSSTTYSVEEGDTATITLVRAEGSSEPVAVYWSLGGTATPILDYTGIWENGTSGPRGVVSFAAGESTKTFTIPTVGGDGYETDETVVLHLLNPTGGPVRGLNDTAVLTIQEADPLPTAFIFAVNLIGPDWPDGAEENDPGFKLVFDVVVEGVSLVPVTLDWNSADGDAQAGPDYVANSGTLFFGTVNGTEIQSVSVTLVNDAIPEVLEYVRGQISNPQNVEIIDYEDYGYIYDDDLATATGLVFADLNGNGFFDEGSEYGLGGVDLTITDFNGDQTTTTLGDGTFSASVILGSVTVTVDETTTPVDSINTTGNNPQDATVTASVLAFKNIGYQVKATPARPEASIGNGLAFFNDTAYGGPGSDFLDGGSGDDWLIGGHWLGPGCACDGNPYDATLKQQTAEQGNRKYVDPASIPDPGTLQGRVWRDVDANNQEGAEFGVKDVQVNLYDEFWTLIAITYTDASGNYKFEKLAACKYYVQVLPPSGNKFATKGVGAAATNSDVSATTGLTDAISVAAGATVGDIDAGLQSVPGGSPGPWSIQFSHLVYSVRETDGFATITINRTPNSFEPVGVYYTLDGTAVTPADYTSAKGTVSFGVDETARSFLVFVIEDAVSESPETVQLILKNPTGGEVKGNLASAILLIFDNPCPDDDVIYGQDGNDVILGDFGYFDASFKAVLLGGMGNDEIYGGNGEDEVYGEGGNDLIEGGADDDALNGGSENDTYLFDGDKNLGLDTIAEVASPFGGNDTFDLSTTSSRAITLDLTSVAVQQVTTTLQIQLPAGNVIENVTGGDQDDTLTGNDLDNILIGGAGDDILTGGRGDDELRGGRGSDTYLFDADAPLGHDELFDNATSATEEDTDLIDFLGTSTQPIALDLSLNVSQTVNVNLSLTLSDGEGIEDLYGGALGDTLTGNNRDNVIWGREGNDTLDGGPTGDSSNDTLKEERGGGFELFDGTPVTLIFNGTETDLLSDFENVSLVGDDNPNTLNAASFSGVVRLDGRGGNDTIVGGSGSNFLTGGTGSDTINGSLGTDLVTEEADANFVLTNGSLTIGAEIDTFIGTIEFASLKGGDGNNTLDASAYGGIVLLDGAGGNDTLIGTAQLDVLIGGAGDDALQGRDGNDTYLFDADEDLGADTITETATGGFDRIDFSPTNTVGVTVHLGLTTLQTVNANLTLVLSAVDVIENLRGGDNDDTLVGNALDNVIEGGKGNDMLTGGLGDDTLDGGANVTLPIPRTWIDRIIETRDVASMVLNDANLTIGLGETDDLIGIEAATLTGGASNNTLNASAFSGSATLIGLDGNDTLTGGSGRDSLIGGGGDDTLSGNAARDTYVFDADSDLGTDLIQDTSGIDTLDYSATTGARVSLGLGIAGVQDAARNAVTNAVLHRLSFAVVGNVENLIGGALADVLAGSDKNNRIEGREGNDLILGGAGNDWLEGQGGDDVYFFDADSPLGLDTLWEGVGTGGTDTLSFALTTTLPVEVNLGMGLVQTVNANLDLRLITCHSIENVIGGALADILIGSTLDNRLEGRAGNDTLAGGWGDDTYAFDADSPLGTDVLLELANLDGGIDTIDLSDTSAAVGVDLGDAAPQLVNANLTLDLSSAAAVENIVGGSGGGSLTGNALDNHLVGGVGADVLSGLGGDDLLEGKAGNDTANGGTGDDTYVFDADTALGTDTLVELLNGGLDTLDFSATTTQSVTVDLGAAAAQAINANLTLILGAGERIENVIGGSLGDRLAGNSRNNRLAGGPGDDVYLVDADGSLGGDLIEEADGAAGGWDTLDFSPTTTIAVIFDLSLTTPQEITATTNLALTSGSSIEAVKGGSQADTLIGNSLDNEITGGPGADNLQGGTGTDTVVEQRDANFSLNDANLTIGAETDSLVGLEQARLTGGAGVNVLDASAFTLGSVILDGGLGNDTLRGGTSALDRVSVERDADMVLSNAALKIGLETDTLLGIETATLVGGASSNVLDASAFTLGPVILAGNAGADSLLGGSGDDELSGGLGSDSLQGGGGINTVVETRDADFLLLNNQLGIGAETDLMSSIQQAKLTGGDGGNVIDASSFSLGPVVLTGLGGIDRLFGGLQGDVLVGGAANDLLRGGQGDDLYRFEDDWGRDSIVETGGFGNDTVDLQNVSVGVSVTIDGAIVVLSGENQVSNASGSLEVILGTAATDAFFVAPSATVGYGLFGGAGTGTDVLIYDAQGLLTTQTDTAISSTGRQAVAIDGFETIEILNAASGAVLAPALPERLPSAGGAPKPLGADHHPVRSISAGWDSGGENLNQEVLLAVARPIAGKPIGGTP
ncbi:MAG: M10 family metallopeptidase C-terminal domain-containing protein [Verrucomicrobiales bacterium]|nr:M10 family metallopeptidase C-terminal domain-containing protein [Verrucomicrobiales bacterium]